MYLFPITYKRCFINAKGTDSSLRIFSCIPEVRDKSIFDTVSYLKEHQTTMKWNHRTITYRHIIQYNSSLHANLHFKTNNLTSTFLKSALDKLLLHKKKVCEKTASQSKKFGILKVWTFPYCLEYVELLV